MFRCGQKEIDAHYSTPNAEARWRINAVSVVIPVGFAAAVGCREAGDEMQTIVRTKGDCDHGITPYCHCYEIKLLKNTSVK